MYPTYRNAVIIPVGFQQTPRSI